MEFGYFSRNGELRPISEATVQLSNIEYQYGVGVYETVRVKEGIPYFLNDHLARLVESARIIKLEHSFDSRMVERAIAELTQKIDSGTYNLKIVLIGGTEPQLNIIPLKPLFPDKKLYRDGVHCVTYQYERFLPHAKTLNMFRSYFAYREAKEAKAYDALLVDASEGILEGTRTNFFCIKGKTLFSPPEEKILLGVTRKVALKVAVENGFTIETRDISLKDLDTYDGAFLTSTSSGIMPIASVGDPDARVGAGFRFGPQPEALKELVRAFDAFVDACDGKL